MPIREVFKKEQCEGSCLEKWTCRLRTGPLDFAEKRRGSLVTENIGEILEVFFWGVKSLKRFLTN